MTPGEVMSMGEGKGTSRGATYLIRDLDQLRLLSDPLRLRLVHAFADEPRTTKQVATVLGEKPTRLYHHVAQLEEAGLLELVETRPVRGTTEKYYRSVGRAFAASPTLFRGPEGAGPAQELIDGILSRTSAELEGLGLDTLDEDDPLGPLVGRARLSIPAWRARELRERLYEWLTECESGPDAGEAAGPEDRVEFAALVAFYPVSPRGPA
jgi:DNA-binding transcriptional ArsR family regulator